MKKITVTLMITYIDNGEIVEHDYTYDTEVDNRVNDVVVVSHVLGLDTYPRNSSDKHKLIKVERIEEAGPIDITDEVKKWIRW